MAGAQVVVTPQLRRELWHQIPAQVRSAVEERTGPVAEAETVGAGSITDLVTTKNFLIDQQNITVVDWSMPCRGTSWIDPALMVVRLIRAGHATEQAERWATLGHGRWLCRARRP
ncbi:hypothetical protein [Actinoplanes sp. NPDC051494]|uniref:hypothetical protein n=1 Tax=Actinoplanes sp. NPDC051494 TaxID=3363907 RepID=UPI003792237B